MVIHLRVPNLCQGENYFQLLESRVQTTTALLDAYVVEGTVDGAKDFCTIIYLASTNVI